VHNNAFATNKSKAITSRLFMLNGIYSNPTTIYFGKGMEFKIGEEVAKYSKNTLLHYGRNSFKEYGLYDKVTRSLKDNGIRYIELGGVKPNPGTDLVYRGIRLCREENLDFVVAVGGGSVIDSAKAISAGVLWPGDFYELFDGKTTPQKALKLGTILTIPGSGSESSTGAIITHEEKKLKRALDSPLIAPIFSILNPELTLTVSKYDTSCGVVDAISHVFERYFTNTPFVDCSDRICEALLKTLMKYALLVNDSPFNYDIRAEIMWACKLAHDNTISFGRKQDWATHRIGHEIGALYDVSHGATMAILFPAWMKYTYKANIPRFEQFANRIFDINPTSSAQVILSAIENLTMFLKAIGMPTTLRELGINDKTNFPVMAQKCVKQMPSGTIGNFTRLAPHDIVNILEIAY